MSGDRWQRVQDLFEQALATPPEERAALLRVSRENDEAIADEVAGLLEAHEKSGEIATLPTTWLRALAGTEPPRFSSGDFVASRYEIRGLIGRGGMGEVYEAWDTGLSIEVALKTLRVATENADSHRRLRTEGFLARSVWHPNVCRVFDLGRHDGPGGHTWFLTMERLRGDTLAVRIRERGKISPANARTLAAQLASALDAAHAAGVVHRDFKPGNVMLVDREGREQAVITDFGISRATDGGDSGDGLGWGTPAYVAPEQLRGEPGGPAADLYAFGVVLYEMATGTLPFGSTLEAARRKLHEEARPPTDIAPELDEAWSRAILRCLEREPRNRFPSAVETIASWSDGFVSSSIHDGASTSSSRGSGLPPERDVFVGRAMELEAIESEFSEGARLLTLVGAAGMGKTRLSVHYGRKRASSWPGGVWFCDLKDCRDVTGIASIVARTLGVSLGRLDPVQQIGQVIAGRGRCLLILDNFDPVVDHADSSLGRWRESAPEGTFLVTSRERLRLAGERILGIEPLSEDPGQNLFVARTQWLCPGLQVHGDELEAVREIVRLVDGMPLAIELAASRARVMDIPQIRDQMRDRFRLLTGGPTARHETLETAISGSWEILAPWERAAWEQCSVFEDGCTLDAAEHVIDLTEWSEAPPVVDVISTLVDRSLLRLAHVTGTEGPRLGMYVSLKEYAHTRLTERVAGPSALRSTEARHGAWYAQRGTDEAVDALDHAGGVERRRTLDRELSNLIAACQRARRRGEIETAVATYRLIAEVTSLRGPFGPSIALGSALLGDPAAAGRARVWILFGHSRMERLAGLQVEARNHALEAQSLARDASDRGLTALLTGWLGVLDYEGGSTDSARSLYESALTMHTEMENHGMCGVVLSHLGILDYMQGRYEDALTRYEGALDLLRRSGDRRREGHVRGYLGTLHRNRGRFDRALAEHTHALAIHREVGDRYYEFQAVGNLGNLHVETGDYLEARRCYESAVSMAREMGDRRNEGLFLSNLANLHLREERFEDARVCLTTALGYHREVGTRTMEGFAQGLMAKLLYRVGRLEDARRELGQAEAIMREVHHDLELAKLICIRGMLEISSSNRPGGTSALEEVEALASARGWETRGELGEMVQELRDALRT